MAATGGAYVDRSSSTAASSSRRSTSPTSRCSPPSTPAARPACSPTASWRPTGPTSSARSSTRSARAASPTRSSASGTPRSPASATSSTTDKVRTALKAVFDKTSAPTSRDHFNPCRIYAYEDEGGLLVGTWPRAPPADGRRPLRRGGLDRPRIHVGLAHDHARPGRRGPRHRPRRARPPRRQPPQPLERHRVRQLLRPLDVELAAGQCLLRPPGFDSAPAGDRLRARRGPATGVYFWSAGRGWGDPVAFNGGTVTASTSSAASSLKRD